MSNEGETALGLALLALALLFPLSQSSSHRRALPTSLPGGTWTSSCSMAGISLCSLPQSVADSSWITELLWTFFVPFTVYQVRYYVSLPVWGRVEGGQGCGVTMAVRAPSLGASAGLGSTPSGPGRVQLLDQPLMWRGLLVLVGEGVSVSPGV